MMVRTHQIGLWACASACALMGAATHAADLESEYSQAANPNPVADGIWSYEEYINSGAVPGGPSSLHPVSGFPFGAGIHVWDQGFLDSAFVSKEIAGAGQTVDLTRWEPDWVVLRPGVNDQTPFVRFTANAPGFYSYTASYESASIEPASSRIVRTVVNGAIAHSDVVNGPVGGAPAVHNSAGVFLNAGDSIEFVVSNGAPPSEFSWNAARLKANVQMVSPNAGAFPCCWEQPWAKPLSAHTSIVQDCNGFPSEVGPIAGDDFICEEDAIIHHLTWWGVNPTTPDRPQRNFYIRFALDLGACLPEEPLLQACIRPKVSRAGVDCEGRPVYYYEAALRAGEGISVLAGQRYWIQIAEVDADMDPLDPNGISSPNPGEVDFAWSSAKLCDTCPAAQISPAGINQPLLDRCRDIDVDLAFTLSSRSLRVRVPLTPIKPLYRIELRDPITQFLRQEISVCPNEFGELISAPNVPEGNYRIVLYGMATPGVDLGVHLLPAVGETDLGFLLPPLGDADNSGAVDFGDVTTVLGNWLAAGPWPLPFP